MQRVHKGLISIMQHEEKDINWTNWTSIFYEGTRHEPAKPTTSQLDTNQLEIAGNGTILVPSGLFVYSVQKGTQMGQSDHETAHKGLKELKIHRKLMPQMPHSGCIGAGVQENRMWNAPRMC